MIRRAPGEQVDKLQLAFTVGERFQCPRIANEDVRPNGDVPESGGAERINDANLFDEAVEIDDTRGGIETYSKGLVKLLAVNAEVLEFFQPPLWTKSIFFLCNAVRTSAGILASAQAVQSM